MLRYLLPCSISLACGRGWGGRGHEAQVMSAVDAVELIPLLPGQGPEDWMSREGYGGGLKASDRPVQDLGLFPGISIDRRNKCRMRNLCTLRETPGAEEASATDVG